MPTLAKKIFLSSTFIDLKKYREAAVHACQRVGLLPVYMEDFPPDPRDAVAVCKAKVEEADLFLGLYAHRYGYTPKDSKVSITEMEYDWAIERGLPVYLFGIDPDYRWPPSKVDKGADYRRLERFKARIGKQHVLRSFRDAQTFKEDVIVLGAILVAELRQTKQETPAAGDGTIKLSSARPKTGRRRDNCSAERSATKVLILAASPDDLNTLRLDEELREINAGLRRARYREHFRLEHRLAVRLSDLHQVLLDVAPQIVHFCGHAAGADGLFLEDNNGLSQPIPNSTLANLFRLFSDQIECVVLSSCYTEDQAKVISEHIRYVVGIQRQISDRDAISFAIGFYNALGAGHSIEFAYEIGRVAIQLESLPDRLIPVLLVN